MKKNIIYIFADQWRKEAIGFEQKEPVKTPNMDRFAENGLVFDNAISTYPLCSPHRGALLTGKYPYTLGLWTNCKTGLDEHVMLKPQEVSIADVLKDNGYQTAYIGKWHLDASELNFDDKPESGAIGWDAYTPAGERRMGFDYFLSYGAMDKHLNPHYWQDTNDKIEPGIWSPAYETDKAVEYIKERDKEKPFCMFISWNPPHPPLELVPSRYVDEVDSKTLKRNVPGQLVNNQLFLDQCANYYGAINGLDEQFGKLMAYLSDTGIAEDTIVVLSADHGEMLGSHGLMGKNVWYEESIKIPFIISGPGVCEGRTDELLSSIDHMPTILDLLEVKRPKSVHGRSLKNIVVNSKESNLANMEDITSSDCIFLSMIPGMPDLIEPFRQRGLNNKAYGWRGIRTKTHTYVVDNGCHPDDIQRRYLYDLINDPYQLEPEVLKPLDKESQYYDVILQKYLVITQDPFLI